MSVKTGPSSPKNEAVRELLSVVHKLTPLVNKLTPSLKAYANKIAADTMSSSQFVSQPLFQYIPEQYIDRINVVLAKELQSSFQAICEGVPVDKKLLQSFLDKPISFEQDTVLKDLNQERKSLKESKSIAEQGNKILDRKAQISLEKSLQFLLGDDFYEALRASYPSVIPGVEQRYQLCIDTINDIREKMAKAPSSQTPAVESQAFNFDTFTFSVLELLSDLEVMRNFSQNRSVQFLEEQLRSGEDIDSHSDFMITNVLGRLEQFLQLVEQFKDANQRRAMLDIFAEAGLDVKQTQEKLEQIKQVVVAPEPTPVVTKPKKGFKALYKGLKQGMIDLEKVLGVPLGSKPSPKSKTEQKPKDSTVDKENRKRPK